MVEQPTAADAADRRRRKRRNTKKAAQRTAERQEVQDLLNLARVMKRFKELSASVDAASRKPRFRVKSSGVRVPSNRWY